MASDNEIVRLSLVARYGRTPVFIGWDDKGMPTISSHLSKEAMADFQSSRESNAEFPNLSNPNVVCFEFSSLGKAIDYPGTSEDVISINAIDENGKSVVLNLGVNTVLNAIDWSLGNKHQWNSVMDAGFIDDGSGVRSTSTVYTFLFQDNRVQNGATCVLLFKPLITPTNESTFMRFVKGVIKQLLIIDESQTPDNRKGYITVAAKATNGTTKSGLADLIFDTNDAKTKKIVSNLQAGGLKFLKTIGVLENVSDELIQEVKDPLPTYNVDSLDLNGLRDLISTMINLSPYHDRP